MPIKSRKLGPGSLTLGSGAMQVNAQLSACKITPSENVEQGDAIKVLSMEVLEGDESVTHSFVLEGTFLQDYGDVASVVDWSWTNMGTEQDFVFIPNNDAERQYSGILVPVPLTVGGDEVDTTSTSDFQWRCKGTPVPAAVGP